jgi:hypothetical protein
MSGRVDTKDLYTFLMPGNSSRFYLMFMNGDIRRLEPYGSNPDIAIFDQKAAEQAFFLSTSASESAPPGDRLVIGYGGPDQTIQVGLIGIHIVEKLPGRIPIDPRSKGQNDWMRYQIEADIDYSALPADF